MPYIEEKKVATGSLRTYKIPKHKIPVYRGIALRTLEVDTEKGVLKVNGRNLSRQVHKMELRFENGVWSLEIEKTEFYQSAATKRH